MSLSIFALVLTAAFIDSLGHVLIKARGDPYHRALGVAIVGGILAAPLLLITGMPDPASWTILVVSILFGSMYWLALGWAYRGQALAVVFPLSRGAGIVLTAIGGYVFLHDRLTPSQNWMLILILAGLGLITFSQGPFRRSAVVPSACLAVVIAGYTLMDATGVRLAGSPLAYCLALYVGNGLVVSALTLPRIGIRAPFADLPSVALAAAMSLTVYGMVLYALAHGPVAVISALAETSILFAALIGILWLRENTTPRHAIGLGLIALGVIMLRLDLWAAPAL